MSVLEMKPLMLKELKAVTPPVQNSLKDLVQGARNISRIGLKRLPTAAEQLLLNEWLEMAVDIIETDRRYR